MVDPSTTITYKSIVYRDTVRIDLTLSDLNYFPVKVADIQNAYTTAPVTEKIQKVLVPAFGEDAGRKAIVLRSLYGLKIAGAMFWNHLADCMHIFGSYHVLLT